MTCSGLISPARTRWRSWRAGSVRNLERACRLGQPNVRPFAFTGCEALRERRLTGVNARRDAEFTEYVAARLAALRRVAFLLCQDWDRADDLVQGASTRLDVHCARARVVEHVDAYTRTILVREFL